MAVTGPALALEGKLDEIIEMILAGDTFEKMRKKYKVSIGTLFNFLNSSENSARAQEAFQMSAHIFTDKAREVLEKASKKSYGEIAVARELAQYYLRMAGFRNRSVYGDRVPIEAPKPPAAPIDALMAIAERISANAAPKQIDSLNQ